MTKKVAVVTGSNKGIGFAIVRGLAKAFDGDVYLTSRNAERGQKAVEDLKKEGLEVLYHQLDIDNEDSIKTLAEFLKSTYGGLDVLVNNAGIAFNRDATEPVHVQAKVTIATNYFSVKNTCDILFPLLRPGARVVNMSSNCGLLIKIPGQKLKAKFAKDTLTVAELDKLMNEFIALSEHGQHRELGWPNSTYVVSKVGLSALTRIQHRENTIEDVAINHVHPGYVDTDMSSHKGPLTPDQGAKSSLFAALLPKNTDIKGQYIWKDCTIHDWVTTGEPS